MSRNLSNYKILTFDTETGGLAANAPIYTFALGITDGFEIEGGSFKEINIKPAIDRVPSPEAFAVTRLKMEKLKQGMTIAQMAKQFQDYCISGPGGKPVAITGYNIKSYDMPLVRYANYTNGLDPYLSEWINSNSKNLPNRVFDVFDIVKVVYALRPELITWAENEDGSVSMKLENLSQVNGIEHEHAHEALSDVYATVGLAKLIDDQNPRLVDTVFDMSSKQVMRPIYADAMVNQSIMLDINSFHGKGNMLTTACVPLMTDKAQKDKVHFLDLRHDPSVLLDLSAEEISEHLYSSRDTEGRIDIGVFSRQNNKGTAVNLFYKEKPIVGDERLDAMNLDMDKVFEYKEILKDPKALAEIKAKIHQVMDREEKKSKDAYDPYAIYSGLNVDNVRTSGEFVSSDGFFDRTTSNEFKKLNKGKVVDGEYQDPASTVNALLVSTNCKDMLRSFQILSRKKWLILNGIPEDISEVKSGTDAYEIKKVIEYVHKSLTGEPVDKRQITLGDFSEQYKAVMERDLDDDQIEALNQLKEYVEDLESRLETWVGLIPELDQMASEDPMIEVMNKIDYMEEANEQELYLLNDEDLENEEGLEP